MSSERPAKRIRQACESCRRKKTKCPGEKPVCSYCARLGQACFYANDSQNNQNTNLDGVFGSDPSRKWEERFQNLENKLAEVLDNQRATSSQQVDRSTPSQAVILPQQVSARLDSTLPPWETVLEAAELYLLYCDCQPFPLFHRETFISSLARREPEVIFTILSLASRFSNGDIHRQNSNEHDSEYTEMARKLVMDRVTAGLVELSTLQTLCLLSVLDFSHGNTHRASIHCSLAMSLAHCAGLTCESQKQLDEKTHEERRRCFWSLFLLKRLYGAEFSVLDFSGEENFPWYPISTGKPCISPPVALEGLPLDTVNQPTKDAGIVAYSIQLSEVWFKTTRYARRRGNPSPLPPWSPKSDYAVIMAQQMDFETRTPNIHRFKPVGFSKRSLEELQKNRDYWGPWLFVQFVYHTNLCLLNHPLLMSLRLRTLQSAIPEIFLQSTADLVTTHEKWIVHLIDILDAKSYKVSDPFLAHCAAIVATIFLQESFEKDTAIRKEKRDNFAKCLKFIEGFQEWPHVARIAEKLKQLETTVSETYHISGNPHTPNRGLLIDLGRFWEILEYSSASEISNLSGTIFGPSLYSSRNRHARTEFSETSALPETTRVGNLAGSEDVPVVSGGMDMGLLEMGDAVESTPLVYSSDELAVLAESFFNQDFGTQGGLDGVDEWWNTGNL